VTRRLAGLFRAIALVLLLAATRQAGAHVGGTTGFATITVSGHTIRYSLQLTTLAIPAALADQMRLGQPGFTPDFKLLLEAIRQRIKLTDRGEPCEAGPGLVMPPPPDTASLTLVVDFVCASPVTELTIHDNLFDVLGTDYHTLAKIEWPGGTQQFAFQPDSRETRVAVAAGGESTRGVGSFFLLGIEHILTGYDHLLFLLALILRGGNLWSLLKIITAFTIAHSITLALAALNIVTLPERLVEAVIALSIAYVAAENLFMRHAVSHRWAVSFLFGLMHGFGFSNALRELGLPREGLVWALLNFNLGVESGQAIAIVLVTPLLLWLRRTRWEAKAVMAMSAVVLAVGLALFLDRAVW